MAGHVLVIGATLLDTKGKPVAGLEPGTSNTAEIRSTRGGTARNVAENLARLGAEVVAHPDRLEPELLGHRRHRPEVAPARGGTVHRAFDVRQVQAKADHRRPSPSPWRLNWSNLMRMVRYGPLRV